MRPTVRPKGKLFLIVDDDVSVQSTITRIVETGGNRVRSASGPEEAFQLSREAAPDAIFWNHLLPEAQGEKEVLRALKAQPAWAGRLIIMTGRIPSDSMKDFLRTHRLLLLFKPVCIEEVQEAVRQVLAGEFDQEALTLR